jgi:hypothetical protein
MIALDIRIFDYTQKREFGKVKKHINSFASFYWIITLTVICMLQLSCDSDVENSILDKQKSPDNMYLVYIFNRGAGATTGFNTQVSILRNNDKFKNKKGNVFICDSDNGNVNSTKEYIKGGPKLFFNWINNNSLEIHYPKGIRIFKMEEKIYNINIKYYED